MTRYFEKNKFCGDGASMLGNAVSLAARVMCNNLTIKEIEGSLKKSVLEKRRDELESNLASSALNMIALCEAVLDACDPDAVAGAYGERVEELAPTDLDALRRELRNALGID